MFTLRIAKHSDIDQVNELRRLAYASSGSFALKDAAALDMRNDPPNSVVIGVWSEVGELAGCVRATLCPTYDDARRVLEVLPPVMEAQLPLLAMCRAATHPAFRGQGILPLMCTGVLEWAQHVGARTAAGVLVAGAPHQRVMGELGFAMQKVVETNSQLIVPNAEFVFIHLGKDAYSSAIARGRNKHAETWSLVQNQVTEPLSTPSRRMRA